MTQNHVVWREDNSEKMQRQEGGGKFFNVSLDQFRFAFLFVGIIFATAKTDFLQKITIQEKTPIGTILIRKAT